MYVYTHFQIIVVRKQCYPQALRLGIGSEATRLGMHIHRRPMLKHATTTYHCKDSFWMAAFAVRVHSVGPKLRISVLVHTDAIKNAQANTTLSRMCRYQCCCILPIPNSLNSPTLTNFHQTQTHIPGDDAHLHFLCHTILTEWDMDRMTSCS